MNKTIHAIYENGVFRPVDSVDLPDNSVVEFDPRLVTSTGAWPEGYFEATAGTFVAEDIERPPQGLLPGFVLVNIDEE